LARIRPESFDERFNGSARLSVIFEISVIRLGQSLVPNDFTRAISGNTT
jgi:hypothetical protein